MSRSIPEEIDVIKVLLRHKRLSIQELEYYLAINKSEVNEFKKLLKKLNAKKEIKIASDGIVSLSRSAKLCIYRANREQRGGIAIDMSSQTQYIIPVGDDLCAIDGDEVSVVQNGVDKEGRSCGVIREIITHKLKNLVGRIEAYKEKIYLVSENDKLGHYPVIVDLNGFDFNLDAVYHTVIVSYPSVDQTYFMAKVINILGELGDDLVFINRILIEANIPLEFDSEALKYVNRLPDEVEATEIKKREDLRNLPFVTIDGVDARDFDDAVFAEINPDGGYILSVAIADVAAYVKNGSRLDEDAFNRSTSVYFPRKVIPMLPEKLSNGLCSLKPNCDRLVLVCHMAIDGDGNILEYELNEGVIYSHYRLTYNQVEDFLAQKIEIPLDIKDSINALHLVYKALYKARQKRGAIDFDSIEPYFEFDDKANLISLKPRMRLESHRLIEECMLAANVSVADFLAKNNVATLYRNHDKPNNKKFSASKAYLDSNGISFDVKEELVRPRDYALLIERLKDHPNKLVIEQIILRSMQLAEYAPKNIGHFGLAYPCYLHFTSPIRRYPDLLVHRGIKALIHQKSAGFKHSMELYGEQTSFCERRADELERKVDAYYKCKYAKTHIGNSYPGVISSVVNFGVFVFIPELLLDGLVHVTELGGDYFIFDEKNHTLIGKNSGFKFSGGDNLEVTIANVNMDKLFIDLELTDNIK